MIAALRRGLYACGLALALAATSVLADVAAPYTEAEAAIRTGDPAKALRLLSSLNPTTPEEAERRHWALAVAHATLGNPEGAVPHLEAAMAPIPSSTSPAKIAATASRSASNTQASTRWASPLFWKSALSGNAPQCRSTHGKTRA